MGENLIHSRFTLPRIFPINGSRSPEQLDRVQNIGGALALNLTPLYEFGRTDKLTVIKGTPTLSYDMTQLEYGSMAIWRAMANVTDPASGGLDESIDLDDIKSTTFDIAAYKTDEANYFVGTALFPKLRVSGFSINISAPDAVVERSFSLVGEDAILIPDNYYNYNEQTVVTPGDEVVTVSPAPIQYASGRYIYRVVRVRSGVATTLDRDQTGTEADSWKYVATQVTVKDCLAGDIVKVFYPSATAYTTLWTDNDADSAALFAENVTIEMKVGVSTDIKKLQSVGIDVSFDRADQFEIGNRDPIQRGVTAKTVTVALDRYTSDNDLETILAGDTTYSWIDPREFVDTIQLRVLIYEDYTKTTFKMGYLITKLSPSDTNMTHDVQDFNQRSNTLESDNLKISTDLSELAFA